MSFTDDLLKLAQTGVLYDFASLPYLKRRTKKPSIENSYSSTREAFLVDVVENSEMTPQEREVFRSLPNHGKTYFRAKRIKYGNYNAMMEVMSAQLYSLTGMVSPDLRLLKMEDSEKGIPEICVASPIVAAFQDLGDFLVDDAVWFIQEDQYEKFYAASKIAKDINKKAQSGAEISGKDKLQRIKALEEIYNLMPAYFRSEIEKAFGASKFIANWDFANFNLANIGCRFMLDNHQKVIKVEAVFVDFGNSGVIGFGGKTKPSSLARANKEAKPRTADSVDYDPSLEFSEKEKDLLINFAFQIQKDFNGDWETLQSDDNLMRRCIRAVTDGYEIAIRNYDFLKTAMHIEKTRRKWEDSEEELNAMVNELDFSSRSFLLEKMRKTNSAVTWDNIMANPEMLRGTIRSIMVESEAKESANFPHIRILKTTLFKDVHHILEQEASLDVAPSVGFLTFSDLPRNLPFAFLLRKLLQEKTQMLVAEGVYNYADSEIEMAFRLSLIPDEAIAKIVEKWNLSEAYPDVFVVPADAGIDCSTAGLIAIFKNRKEELIRKIPQKIIKDWIDNNKTKALAAYSEVELAIEQKVGAGIFKSSAIFEGDKSGVKHEDDPESAKFDAFVQIMKREISQFEEKLSRDKVIAEKSEKWAKMVQAQADTSDMFLKNMLNEMVDKAADDLKFYSAQLRIDFLQQNMPKWSKFFEMDPSHNPFDLERMRKIYRATNGHPKTDEGGNYVSDEENAARNSASFKENSFIYEKFMGILNRLTLSPAKVVKAASNPAIRAVSAGYNNVKD